MRTTLRLTATAAAAVTKSDEGKQLDDYHKEMHYTVDSYHTRHEMHTGTTYCLAGPAPSGICWYIVDTSRSCYLR